MKHIIIALSLVFCFITHSVITHAQTQINQNHFNNGYVTDLNIALKLAKETKQNIVLIFSANWCGHCKNLKNDLPNLEGFDNKIICILDSDKEKRLTRQFRAKSLPTSVILNSNGEEVSRLSGYDKNSYTKWLKNN